LIQLQLGDEALGGVAFEIPDDISQIGPGHHQVQMVVQDGIKRLPKINSDCWFLNPPKSPFFKGGLLKECL
jgi:hypothetical protein